MKNILFVLLSLLLFTSCKEQFKITGVSSVQNFEGQTFYLKMYQDDKMVTVDSATIVHGRFGFSGPMDSVSMACLYYNDMCLVPVVLEKGDIMLKLTDAKQYPYGTPMNDSLTTFINQKASLESRLEELSSKEGQMVMDGVPYDSIVVVLSKEAEQINAESDKLISSFISKNYDNVLGAGVFMILTSNFPYPVLNPQIEAVLGMGTPYFLENPYVKEYVRVANENMEKLREEELE